MTEDEKSVRDRVLDVSTRNFWISRCPERTFQRFIALAEIETKKDYSMMLKILLDAYENDAKALMLFEKIELLNVRVAELESAFVNTAVVKKSNIPKTFGRGTALAGIVLGAKKEDEKDGKNK